MSYIDLTSADGHSFSAYEQHPEGATSSVVIIQEIFGVNPHIRSVVDRYAERGYHAIAPAIFDRVERGVELDYDDDGMNTGRGIAGSLDWDEMMTDVAATVEHGSATGPVAVVGFCYGGSVAWASAHSLPVACAVGYYGGRITSMLDEGPIKPIILHFGALDQAIPLDGVAKIGEQYPDVPIHIYDEAGHGFACDARGSYHQPSTELALTRTMELLETHLR